jgi:L-fucose isomerase-like protein
VFVEQIERGADAAADRVVEKLGQARVSVIGEHPAGFDTCEFDANELHELTGISVDHVKLDDAFEKAKSASAARANAHRAEAAKSLAGLDDVDQEQLDRSFRLLCALEDIADENNADSIAVRCWPETFVEYGCAACGPMAMMNQAGVPSACEADVYGSVTTLMLQELAGEPVWMADLVDVDKSDNTAVLWHCGLAPLSMCDPEAQAEATIHTNRKMPLLHQFPLKPGRVTLARLSQAKNSKKLMIAGAEVLRAPMAFTGTSGVIRFDKGVAEVCATIMDEGLEHHFSLAYGDHLDSLRQIANRLHLPVLQIA